MSDETKPRIIYLRVDDDLANALAVAANEDLRSVNAYCSAILADYLIKAGYLSKG